MGALKALKRRFLCKLAISRAFTNRSTKDHARIRAKDAFVCKIDDRLNSFARMQRVSIDHGSICMVCSISSSRKVYMPRNPNSQSLCFPPLISSNKSLSTILQKFLQRVTKELDQIQFKFIVWNFWSNDSIGWSPTHSEEADIFDRSVVKKYEYSCWSVVIYDNFF